MSQRRLRVVAALSLVASSGFASSGFASSGFASSGFASSGFASSGFASFGFALSGFVSFGIAAGSSGEGLAASEPDGPRAWIEAPAEVSVGAPFELRVRVLVGDGQRVSLARPASTLALRIGEPLRGPAFDGIVEVARLEKDSTLGWWAIACVDGEQALPEVRVTGWPAAARDESWSVVTPPQSIRAIGSVTGGAAGSSLRTRLSWLPAGPASTPLLAWVWRGALGLALGLALWFAISRFAARARHGSARASGVAPHPMSAGLAAHEAELALRAALEKYLHGDSTVGEATAAAAYAVRVFVGRLAGVDGLARCADELDRMMRVRVDLQLEDGVSRLIRESEVSRYAAPTDGEDGRREDVRAMIHDALREIEKARGAKIPQDVLETAGSGGKR